jgi:tRNA(Ile)-lysidine synthase
MSQHSEIRIPWWSNAALEQPNPLVLWRPFLDEPRSDLLGYVAQHQLTPIIDPTNEASRFRRNRIRGEILPLLESISPGSSAALSRFAELVSSEDAYLDDLAAIALARVRSHPHAIDRQLLIEEPRIVQRRILRSWLGELAVAELSLDRIDAIIRTAEHYRQPARIEISGNEVVVVDNDNISFRHSVRPNEATIRAEDDAP